MEIARDEAKGYASTSAPQVPSVPGVEGMETLGSANRASVILFLGK